MLRFIKSKIFLVIFATAMPAFVDAGGCKGAPPELREVTVVSCSEIDTGVKIAGYSETLAIFESGGLLVTPPQASDEVDPYADGRVDYLSFNDDCARFIKGSRQVLFVTKHCCNLDYTGRCPHGAGWVISKPSKEQRKLLVESALLLESLGAAK